MEVEMLEVLGIMRVGVMITDCPNTFKIEYLRVESNVTVVSMETGDASTLQETTRSMSINLISTVLPHLLPTLPWARGQVLWRKRSYSLPGIDVHLCDTHKSRCGDMCEVAFYY